MAAAQHEAMRTLLEGAGKVGGVGGRAIDTVAGLYDLLKEASPVTQLGKSWTAIEYVNQYGMQAYLDAEQAKSSAMWSGLYDSAKGYLGDIGSTIQNNLLGGPQWDIYDVYLQGNAEGKIGFDVLGFFVGGSELNAAAKTMLTDRIVAAAFKDARDEAIESARISNNFYGEGSALSFPQELKTSGGIVIKANPDKTTTVLGTFAQDTNSIINGQLSKPKGTVYDQSTQPGSFNLLNTPNGLYDVLGPDRFWTKVNKPFLDAAIQRGDDIVLATTPDFRIGGNVYGKDGSLTGFGRELDYLKRKGYVYDTSTGKMVRGGPNDG